MKTNLDQRKIAQEVALILIKIGAVTFRFDPPYIFTSGLKSPIYLDNKIVMSYPKERERIINSYMTVIKKLIGLKNVDYISATATAAIPQGAWIAQKLKLPLVFVRPTTKSYGKGNKLEGHLKKGSKVVIIEDHISTATSLIGNAQTVRELGGKVKFCVSTTNYESQKFKEKIKENSLKVISLTTGKIIVEEAYKKGIINNKQKQLIDLWFEDPVNWAQKYL